MRNYIGLFARGFDFSSEHRIGTNSKMPKYIGRAGEIIFQNDYCVQIRFQDGNSWSYPIEEINNHLINKTMNYSEVKMLYELLDSKDNVLNALRSINRGTVSIDNFIDEDYFEWQGEYYSSEDYVVTSADYVIDREDSWYCDGIGEYVHIDNTRSVYEGSNETRYSIGYLRDNDYTEFRGDYYDDAALDRHDIVWREDTDDYDYDHNSYWCESSSVWLSEFKEEYVRGYHNGSYQSLNFNDKSKYRIGYEIEKEDETVRNSVYIDDFERDTDGIWRKEKDGSLDSEAGYELISPTFEFDIDKIFEHIEGNELLVSHIDAEISTSCGGHIHLSEKGLNGNELFNKVKGYTPLFYALYYGRVNKSYAKGKSNRDLEYENEKYQAIKIHHDRVEFRIISAVPNVKTLKWRTKLLMMILQHPTDSVIKAYYNVDTKFTKLLKQTYSDEKLIELKDRFIKFTKEFENLDINK